MEGADPYRFRILFADDQEDVARTLAGLFKQPNIKVEYATSGELALDLCRRKRFDLLIVDLAMPPERWGGLWLIRLLRRDGFDIPILVLSGQASQTETIEALHLRAKGFVLKDNASRELRERVLALLEHVRPDARRSAVDKLPLPVAVQCGRIDSAETLGERLIRTLYSLEYALRLICLVGVAEARWDDSPEAKAFLADVSSLVMSPGLGTSNAVRRRILSQMPNLVAASWAAWFDERLTDQAIAIRNSLSHVQLPSRAAAIGPLKVVDAALDAYLTAAVSTPSPEIVAVNGLSYDGSQFDVSTTLLHSDHMTLPQRRKSAGFPPPITTRVYLWHTRPIDLWPFITVEPRREVGSLEVCIFDGPDTNSSHWGPDDPLRYIKIREGERVKSDIPCRASRLPNSQAAPCHGG
jgi:CheY-like chemotaxis protein